MSSPRKNKITEKHLTDLGFVKSKGYAYAVDGIGDEHIEATAYLYGDGEFQIRACFTGTYLDMGDGDTRRCQYLCELMPLMYELGVEAGKSEMRVRISKKLETVLG